MNPNNRNEILSYLLGGGLLGAGAGLVTTGMRQRQKAQEDADALKATNADDNVLYVHLPVGKAAGLGENMLTDGVALGGGTLSALGAYTMVNNFFRNKERQRLQKELDEAQNMHVGQLAQEGAAQEKAAASLTGAVGGGTLLLAIATAVLANKALDKHFPTAKAPGSNGSLAPKRVVLMRDDPEKVASEFPNELVQEEAEHLIRIASELEPWHGDINNVIRLISAGRTEDLAKAAGEGRLFEFADESSRGLKTPTYVRRKVAYYVAAGHPDLAPQLVALAAATCVDRVPTYMQLAKAASALGLEPDLRVIAVAHMQETRRAEAAKTAKFYEAIPVEKFASMGVDLAEMLGLALATGEDGEHDPDDGSQNLDNDESEVSTPTLDNSAGPISNDEKQLLHGLPQTLQAPARL